MDVTVNCPCGADVVMEGARVPEDTEDVVAITKIFADAHPHDEERVHERLRVFGPRPDESTSVRSRDPAVIAFGLVLAGDREGARMVVNNLTGRDLDAILEVCEDLTSMAKIANQS